ncbi:MAG: hypothetical protein M1835_004007, partial [Candelina submexicana]
MADTPTIFHVAQVIGITASAFLSGSTIALSYYAVPSFLLAPTPLLLRQWRAMYDRGKVTGPPLSILGGLSYAYLAYHTHYNNFKNPLLLTGHASDTSVARLYVAAALLSLSVAPFTAIFMLGTNAKLTGMCEEMEGLGIGEEVQEKGKRESARALAE